VTTIERYPSPQFCPALSVIMAGHFEQDCFYGRSVMMWRIRFRQEVADLMEVAGVEFVR